MTDIQLVNENGVIVGRDPDTGEKVPISFETIQTKKFDNVFHASQHSGSDGGTKIQNALNAANTNAGTNAVVIGPNGPDSPTSAPESNVWEVSSNINIEGYDHTHIIGRGSPLLFLSDSSDIDILRSAADNTGTRTTDVTIRGIRFHGNKANQSGSIGPRSPDSDSDNDIKGSAGLRVVYATDWLVEDCRFINCQRFGFCVKESEDITVRSCYATGCGDDGFTATNQYFQNTNLNNILFDDITGNNNADQGLEIEDGVDGVRVTNSQFNNNGNTGMTVKSHVSGIPPRDEEPCSNVTIHNCEFDNNTYTDIVLSSSNLDPMENITISDCNFHVTDGYGVGLGKDRSQTYRNITIENCYFDIDGGVGAFANNGADSDTVKDLTVDCEIYVTDDTNAAYMIRVLNSIVRDVTISAQIRFGSSTPNHSSPAIQVRANVSGNDLKDITFTEDTFVQGSGGSAIQLISTSSNSVVENVTVGGTYKNNRRNNSGAAIVIEDFGTAVNQVSCLGVRAYDDQGTKTQEYGIARQSGDYHLYDGCNLRGNKTGAFNGSAANNSVVGDNIT